MSHDERSAGKRGICLMSIASFCASQSREGSIVFPGRLCRNYKSHTFKCGRDTARTRRVGRRLEGRSPGQGDIPSSSLCLALQLGLCSQDGLRQLCRREGEMRPMQPPVLPEWRNDLLLSSPTCAGNCFKPHQQKKKRGNVFLEFCFFSQNTFLSWYLAQEGETLSAVWVRISPSAGSSRKSKAVACRARCLELQPSTGAV